MAVSDLEIARRRIISVVEEGIKNREVVTRLKETVAGELVVGTCLSQGGFCDDEDENRETEEQS